MSSDSASQDRVFSKRKRGVDHEGGGAPITREFLSANTLFYGFLFVGILFFWNWFGSLSPDFTAVGTDAVSLVWAFIDAALPLLSGVMGPMGWSWFVGQVGSKVKVSSGF